MAAITLLNVEQIIKQPSGLVFIYDTNGVLLQTPRKTKEIRRLYTGGPPPVAIGWAIQFTFEDNAVWDVQFEINYITLIQYEAGKFQTFTNLGDNPTPGDMQAKFEAVYEYLAEFVFRGCCDDDPDNPIFAYPTNTYANWLIALNADLLPKGLWIEVTDIPSQPSAIFSLFCTETNQIALGGKGQFLNADWQNVGDYSGAPLLFVTNEGQWYGDLELVTITYNNLAGGSFAPAETITDSVTGATATIVTDDGSTITAYLTSPAATFGPLNSFDNGTGVSADVVTYVQPLENGDVVIYNALHYQVTAAATFDGTDPATNSAAYTLLPKATADMGYILEVDEIEFDFVPDWLQYRADKRGNRYAYSQDTDTNDFALTFTAIDQFQWGRDAAYGHFITQSRFDNLNLAGPTNRKELTNFSAFYNNTLDVAASTGGFNLSNGAYFINNEINASMSAIAIHAAGFNSCIINQPVTQFDISTAALLENKTFNAICSGWNVSTNMTFTETISTAINTKTQGSGLSTQPRTLDITGLTTIDIGTNAELVGIYNLTSSNATETVNLISNFPTLFPFTLKPAAGLVVTVTFTAVGLLSAVDEIVGPTVDITLNGDNGDELTLQAATIGGFAVTVQKDANTNI